MAKYVFVTVAFQPRDRAALARAAHARNESPAEFLERLAIEWLDTEKLRTVPIPETRDVDSKSPRKLRSVPTAANQSRFDVT